MRISKRGLAYLVVFWILMSVTNTYIVFTDERQISGASVAYGTVSVNITSTAALGQPSDLYAELISDDVSVYLNWTQALKADNYTIFYSTNITALKQLDWTQITNVTGIPDNNWTDYNALSDQRRYYTVSAVKGTSENFSEEYVGKFDIDVYAADLTPGNVEINTISFPLILNNYSIGAVVRNPSANDIISWYNPNNSPPSFDSAYYTGASWLDFGLSTFEPGQGYYFGPVGSTYNLTVVGRVPENNFTVEVKAANLVPGNVEINTLGWHTIYATAIGNAITNPSANDIISWYNPNNSPPSFDSAYYTGASWLDFGLLTFEPGQGYYFGPVGASYNWTYNRTDPNG